MNERTHTQRSRLDRQPVIPRGDLLPGIRECFRKTTAELQDALLLARGGSLESAASLYVLGIQELGKAQMLRDAYDSGEATPRITGFADHEAKVEKGFSVAGSSASWLRRSAFQTDAFQGDAFQIDAVPANEPTRLDLVYVNYGSTGWLIPPVVDPSELVANIESTLRALPDKEMQLLTP